MKKGTVWQRVGDFIVGKGFYIVLFLCVATIGISGYYLVTVFSSGEGADQPVTGGAQVVIPDDEQTVKPSRPDPLPDSSATWDTEEPYWEQVLEPEPIQPSKTEEPAPELKEPDKTDKTTVSTAPVYTWPVKGEVISNFSLEVLAYDETMADWRTHSGVDIASPVGTRVLAMSSGTVSKVYQDDLMGTAVVIDHGKGLVSTYYNLGTKPTVSEGDEVVTGTVIGTVGQTAIAEISRPSHLHLELTLNGNAVDPANYLPKY